MARHALSYCGVPFRHQGRNPARGLDCVGVAICALRAEGFEVRDARDYRETPRVDRLPAALRDHFGAPRALRQDGDVLLFWIERPELTIHCGVAARGGFVHVMRDKRVTWSPLVGEWRQQLVGAYGVR